MEFINKVMESCSMLTRKSYHAFQPSIFSINNDKTLGFVLR